MRVGAGVTDDSSDVNSASATAGRRRQNVDEIRRRPPPAPKSMATRPSVSPSSASVRARTQSFDHLPLKGTLYKGCYCYCCCCCYEWSIYLWQYSCSQCTLFLFIPTDDPRFAKVRSANSPVANKVSIFYNAHAHIAQFFFVPPVLSNDTIASATFMGGACHWSRW